MSCFHFSSPVTTQVRQQLVLNSITHEILQAKGSPTNYRADGFLQKISIHSCCKKFRKGRSFKRCGWNKNCCCSYSWLIGSKRYGMGSRCFVCRLAGVLDDVRTIADGKTPPFASLNPLTLPIEAQLAFCWNWTDEWCRRQRQREQQLG